MTPAERTLREALADLCGLRETISDDVEAFDVGRHPETGEWRVWHEDYPEEGSMPLALASASTPEETDLDALVDAFEAAVDAFWQPEHDGTDADVVAARRALLSAIGSSVSAAREEGRRALAAAERRAEDAERERDEALSNRLPDDAPGGKRSATTGKPWTATQCANFWGARAAALEAGIRDVLAGHHQHHFWLADGTCIECGKTGACVIAIDKLRALAAPAASPTPTPETKP